MLTDAQLGGEYLGRYRVPVGYDGYSFRSGAAGSDEEGEVASLVVKVIVMLFLVPPSQPSS